MISSFHPKKQFLRQAKGLDLSFPLLCDYDGRVAKAFGAYLELEEQGVGVFGEKGRSKTHVYGYVCVCVPAPSKGCQMVPEVSMHHPLGFNWHPFEGVGVCVLFFLT